MYPAVQIGIIGGSGLSYLDFLEDLKPVLQSKSNTIYDNMLTGIYRNIRVVFIPRHGFYHEYSPSKVPYHDMMYALKYLGCTHIIATTSVLSLSVNTRPGDIVIVDSFIDGTEKRINSYYPDPPYFGDEQMTWKSLSSPFSDGMSMIIKKSADSLGMPCRLGGVVMTVEGPRFPSLVETALYSSFGADILNFTTVPEVYLARELAMHYVSVAMVTDFDPIFQDSEKEIRDILTIFYTNISNVKKILMDSLPKIASADWTKENADLEIPRMKTLLASVAFM